MSLAAIEKQQRAMAARTRTRGSNLIPMAGPQYLQAKDGLIDPQSWSGEIPSREWIVDGVIPHAQLTMVNGNGGGGKSLLVLQMVVAAVARMQWIGMDVRESRCLYVSCEDDQYELRRRIDGILSPHGKDFSDLDGLSILDRDDADSNLFYEAEANAATGRFTNFFMMVKQTVLTLGAEILVLDSLYDFFGGNENVRTQVTEFMGALKRAAKELQCAIVIIAHPSRAGMGDGGDGTSGSTAWHNKVRSRLYMHQEKAAKGAPVERQRKMPMIVEHMKNNYGQRHDPVIVRWDHGRFVVNEDPISAAAVAEDYAQSQRGFDL